MTKEKIRWIKKSAGFGVRSTVHEYGGVAFVVYNNTLFFTSSKANVIMKQHGADGVPTFLTTNPYTRYADGSYSPKVSIFTVC